uniref:Uncharacterized protein n=1 Tax=Triticum urartu TaxID=4572 RepID=A0A8R7NZX5_TRIUA
MLHGRAEHSGGVIVRWSLLMLHGRAEHSGGGLVGQRSESGGWAPEARSVRGLDGASWRSLHSIRSVDSMCGALNND